MKSILQHNKEVEKLNKKGQGLGGLGGSVIAIVVAVIILVIGLVIVQELRDTQLTTSTAWFSANTSLGGLTTFSDFVNIIVLAVVASVVIGLILSGFAFSSRRGR